LTTTKTGKPGAVVVAGVNEDSSSHVSGMGRGIFVVTGQSLPAGEINTPDQRENPATIVADM